MDRAGIGGCMVADHVRWRQGIADAGCKIIAGGDECKWLRQVTADAGS